MEKISFKKHIPTFVSIAIGIVLISILIIYFNVPRKIIIGWGVLSWVVGVAVIKVPIYHLIIVRYLHPKLSNIWLGFSNGVVSAAGELGSALFFFYFVLPNELTLPQLIGFGLAAGVVESIILPFMGNPLSGTPIEGHSEFIFQKTNNDIRFKWMELVERLIAYLIHTFSRGLIYISKTSGFLIPAILAFSAFAFTDGKAYYDLLEKKDFSDIRIAVKFYFQLMLIALLLTCSFILFLKIY